MINPAHLASLVAIADHGGFAAAGHAIGRSHSAVSLHIKALEDRLGTRLVDRTVRPAALTPDGAALVREARRLREVMDGIEAIGRSDRLVGTLRVGVVPTAMASLVPPALARIRAAHSDLTLRIQTGLSGELAQAVRSGDLDAALATAPAGALDDLGALPVAREPLVVIGPEDAPEPDADALIAAHPFIWFSRRTWAGQAIERLLAARRIVVRSMIEVDSLEAIEQLVRHGLGVAVVPDRMPRAPLAGLRRHAFGSHRDLVLLTRTRSPMSRLTSEFVSALGAAATAIGTALPGHEAPADTGRTGSRPAAQNTAGPAPVPAPKG